MADAQSRAVKPEFEGSTLICPPGGLLYAKIDEPGTLRLARDRLIAEARARTWMVRNIDPDSATANEEDVPRPEWVEIHQLRA